MRKFTHNKALAKVAGKPAPLSLSVMHLLISRALRNMGKAGKIIGWVISSLLIVFCAIDLISQYRAGEGISWRVPIIFFGVGIGLPLIAYLLFSGDGESVDHHGDLEVEHHSDHFDHADGD